MTLAIALTRNIAACRALRRTVFIEEQGVSEVDEVDDLDGEALHLLATLDDRAVGTARIVLTGDIAKIGRVCVLASARGHGIGAALIHAAVAELSAMPGVTRAKLGAQTHALGFYAALGFVAQGPEYIDAGIPHRDMVRDLPPAG